MRRTIKRWFWAWDFEKEESWLNQMAAQGLALVAVGFCTYTFEECVPGEYNVRLELLENVPTHVESQRYIQFIEETGAEYLGSVVRWAYFRCKTNGGEFRLHSDQASRIKHLNRMLTLIGAISITNLCTGLGNASIYFSSKSTGNLIIGLFGLALGLLAAFGALRIYRKKKNLQKQQNLFE